MNTNNSTPDELTQWQRRIEQMQACVSSAELVEKHGAPDHKDDQGGIEVWHYPLGIDGGTVYSIHVAVMDGRPQQVYLFMEPASNASRRAKRPWWRFW